jgi:hypothetical protein
MDDSIRLDALLKLAGASWEGMNQRRQYEWKVSLGLWTALTAFSAIVVRREVAILVKPPYLVGLIGTLAVIFLAYVFVWLAGIAERQKRDRALAEAYWTMAEETLNISVRNKYVDPASKAAWFVTKWLRKNVAWWNWSHNFQILITLLLSFLVVWSVLYAGNITHCASASGELLPQL